MNGTLKAMATIGARRAADRELSEALRKFNKAAEQEPFHNGLWDISEEGIARLSSALERVKAAKRNQLQAQRSIENGLQSFGGAR